MPRIAVTRTLIARTATDTTATDTTTIRAVRTHADFSGGAGRGRSKRIVVHATRAAGFVHAATPGVSTMHRAPRFMRDGRERGRTPARSRQPMPTEHHVRSKRGRASQPSISPTAVAAARLSVPARRLGVPESRSSAPAGTHRHRRSQPWSPPLRTADAFGAGRHIRGHAAPGRLKIKAPRRGRRPPPESIIEFDRRSRNALDGISPGIKPHRAPGVARAAAVRSRVTASGRSIVLRQVSERGHAPATERLRPRLDRPRIVALAALAAYGVAAEPVQRILRRRAAHEERAGQANAAARPMRAIHEPRPASIADRDEPIRETIRMAADAAEMHRILMPLLQETIFSEQTMGRLANGVMTQIDRRESAERYRKSGGR
ncbi:hypothetical protein C0Z17_14525 [Trinickia caryophylli]|nr:hypothetical protein C0Z17_14525 [Trinickia caryophylli]